MTDAHYIGPLTDTANEAQAVLEILLDALANSGFQENPDRNVSRERLADIDPLVIEATARLLSAAMLYTDAEIQRRKALLLEDGDTLKEKIWAFDKRIADHASQHLTAVQTGLWAIAQQHA